MHQETKLDPPGSHALRVLPSGSERMQTAECRTLRGFGSWLPYFPVLPHWANSFRPAGAGAGALPSDSRSHRRELRLLQSMKTHAGAQDAPVEIQNDPLPGNFGGLTRPPERGIMVIRTNVRSESSMPLSTVETRAPGLSANGGRPKTKTGFKRRASAAVRNGSHARAAGTQASEPSNPNRADTRFDRRLAEVLHHASRIFCEKGYEGASMRDLSRASGMSLAGLYHYCESKEELLYLIQKHTFRTIIATLRRKLGGSTDPQERIHIFIANHIEYFLANKEAMKVLTHEDETLKNGRGTEIAAIKREYYRICLGLVEDLPRPPELPFSPRVAVLSLFGMINWVYTWHNPRVDADAGALARKMGGIFLHGVLGGKPARRKVETHRLNGFHREKKS